MSPQDRKALGKPIASSTPTPHDQDFQDPENISQVAAENKPGKCIYPWNIVSERNTQQFFASTDLACEVTNKAMRNCLLETTLLTGDTLKYPLQCVIHNATSGKTFLLLNTFFMNNAENNLHDHIAAYACEKEAVNYDNFVFIVNPGAHCYLIIANLESKHIFAVDSLIVISNRSIHKYMKKVSRILRAAFSVASLLIMKEKWTFVYCSDVPQQRNTYDCGVHAVVSLFCLANILPLPKQIQSSNARQRIKKLITTNNLSLSQRTKPPKRLKQAKHNVKKTWPKKIEDLRIVQKSIDEWYGTVELTSKRWKTFDARNCSGNKEDAKQIFWLLVASGITKHAYRTIKFFLH